MDGVLRKHLREQLHKHAQRRIEGSHVEFCSQCGKTYERRGRRTPSCCQTCSRKRKEEA